MLYAKKTEGAEVSPGIVVEQKEVQRGKPLLWARLDIENSWLYPSSIGSIRMKMILTVALLTCLAAVTYGQKAGKSDNAEFKALSDRYFAAWSSLNPDNAAPLYAKDADLVFYDIAPLKYTGWAEYEKGVRGVLGGFESLRLTPNSDLKATRRSNIAWTTVTFHLSAKQKGGGQMETDGRHTAIWERRGGKWMIVHEHFSAPLPG